MVSEDPPGASSALRFRVHEEAWQGTVELAALGWLEHDGEQWPLPVGPPGMPGANISEGINADVLGSTFWWLAGVQEAITIERDRHGRFPYARSLQFELAHTHGSDTPGTAMRPAVDAYRQWLGEALRQLDVEVPDRTWSGKPWALALTHDVDALDAGRLRGLVGETLRGHPMEALRRAGGRNERRASLDALIKLARSHGVRSTVFMKAGAGAPEDVPYALTGSTRTLLREITNEGFEVGLHPSYAAADHPRQLDTEHARLAAALGAPPTTVRTHFLRWFDPLTPRLLGRQGFQIDSSLGFSETSGFRRGTAHPFQLYDLHMDCVRPLWEMPLAVMDTTLFDHRGLSDADALARALSVCEAAQRAGGVAVVLWHSFVGGDVSSWRRKLVALEAMVHRAQETRATIGPLGSLLEAWRETPVSSPTA
ncbi:MAG: polysaccharide deacetylase family protein [Rubricoccaceae bacterium]